jgi:hypothetical protein
VILFLTGAIVIGDRPDFDAPGSEVAAHVADQRTRIQVGAAIDAAMAPFLVWFLATIASLAREAGAGAGRAGMVAYGCGLIFVALFLADVTALAVSALRPENLASEPELATALRDFEWLAMGIAAPVGAGVLAAFAVLVLRDKAIWPRWLGWLAGLAALAYGLRIGTLFTVSGPFAADGLLGLWTAVGAFAGWILIASFTLTLELRRAPLAAQPGAGANR